MNKFALVLLVTSALLLAPHSVMGQDKALTQPIREAEREMLFPSAELIDRGQSVARTACAECHGMDGMKTGEGQPFLAGQRAVYLYRVFNAYQEGSRHNESMRHISDFLSDDAQRAVAAYYANLPWKRPSEAPEADQAAALLGDDPFSAIGPALRKCTRCHGETGNSETSGMPNLTAQHPDYFVTSMMAYVEGDRDHRIMKKMVGALDESTIDQMGQFYAVQEPLATSTSGDGDAEAGRAAAEACANCHGSDGNATGSDMPSLAGQDARYFIKAMEAYKSGEREHEAMVDAAGGLTGTEIENLAAFYAKQTPVRRDVRIPYSTAEWVERCERCHGMEGNSTDPRFPMIAGQNVEYLRKVMLSYANGERPTSVMHAMSEPLTETDVDQIVNYFATREPKSVIYLQVPCEEGITE